MTTSRSEEDYANRPFKFTTLDELDKVIDADPTFFFWYRVRVNVRARASQNSVIRSCEIDCYTLINQDPFALVHEGQEHVDRLEQLFAENEKSGEKSLVDEVNLILNDLKKFVSILNSGLSTCRRIYMKIVQEKENAVKLETSFEYHVRGNLFQAENVPEQSITDFTKAIELNPYNFIAFKGRSLAHFSMSNYERALEDANKAIELVPVFGRAYEARARVFFRKKMFASSLKDYNKAINLLERGEVINGRSATDNDSLSKCLTNRAQCFRQAKYYSHALSDYNRAIELDASNHDAVSGRGIVFCLKREYATAIKNFSRVLKAKPKDEGSLIVRGISYLGISEYFLAINDYTTLINTTTTDVEIKGRCYRDRGLCFLMQMRFENAIMDFTSGKNLNLNLTDYNSRWRNIAVAQWKKKIMKM